jgi:hypothetical protein
MRVLVACEHSGVVRDAFIARGHDAMSCDLLPTERPGPHYEGDVFDVIDACWDVLIGHPECTHLAVSGSLRFPAKRLDGRQAKGASFFMRLAKADIRHICIENPVCVMSTWWRKPDQIIQPYQFGHDASKKTALWLKNLPPLRPTQFVEPRYVDGLPRWANQTDSGQNKLPPSDDRWALRSKTYEGIAMAMATQWTDFLEAHDARMSALASATPKAVRA